MQRSHCFKSGSTWTSCIITTQADTVCPSFSPSPACANVASLPNLSNAPHASLIKSPGPIHPKSEYMQLTWQDKWNMLLITSYHRSDGLPSPSLSSWYAVRSHSSALSPQTRQVSFNKASTRGPCNTGYTKVIKRAKRSTSCTRSPLLDACHSRLQPWYTHGTWYYSHRNFVSC